MRVGVIGLVLMWAGMAMGVAPTPTPFTPLKLNLPNPLPISQTWAQQLVQKLSLAQFCGIESCQTLSQAIAGGGGGGSGGFTIAAATCPDDGTGARGTLTLNPACGHMCATALTVLDPDGCDVTIDESTSTAGDYAIVVNISSNFAKFTTQVNELFFYNVSQYLNEGAVLSIGYIATQWVVLDGNAPDSAAIAMNLITDPSDFPSTASNECKLVCADSSLTPTGTTAGFLLTGDGNSLAIGPCPCPGPNGSIVVGDNCVGGNNGSLCFGNGESMGMPSFAIGSDVHAMGDRDIVIGDGPVADGPDNICIGTRLSSINGRCLGENAISIGSKDVSNVNDLTGDNSVQLGFDPVSQNGADSVCIGRQTTCDNVQDFVFGSTAIPLHPVWPGIAPGISACGTSPAIAVDSTDVVGNFTVGSAAPTSCTITFNRAWAKAPSCFASDETNPNSLQIVTTTTTMIVSAAGSLDSDTIKYGCPVSPQ